MPSREGKTQAHTPHCLNLHLEPVDPNYYYFLHMWIFRKTCLFESELRQKWEDRFAPLEKPHPDYSARSLGRQTEGEFLPGPVGFSHLHKIHIYLQLSELG